MNSYSIFLFLLRNYNNCRFLVTFADRKSYRFKQQEIMPLRIPDKLPAIDILKKENIFEWTTREP